MKLIHVAGFSNSGKTTLILELIPVLATYGKVGVIKHLGHHLHETNENQKKKDTSRFFEARADFVAGIDAEKTVITMQSISLDDSAALCDAANITYLLIEGFRPLACKKIWLGTPEQAEEIGIASYCILWNPTVDDIIKNRDAFDSWHPAFFSGHEADKPTYKIE